MTYDNAGNLITDTYSGAGARTYDADNRMTTAADNTGEEVIPEVERGAPLRQYTGAYNRQGYGETSVYEKVQIDLSIVCRQTCGVYHAEVRLKQ